MVFGLQKTICGTAPHDKNTITGFVLMIALLIGYNMHLHLLKKK